MKKLDIDVIANSGFVNLLSEFEVQFSEAKTVSIATAFITHSSISLIHTYLKDCTIEKKSMQLIIGLYGGFNAKKDLLELIGLVKKYPDNFQARISLNAVFHWKYYRFANKNYISSYVGSSNFTNSGMSNPGELTIKLTGNSKTRPISILDSEFRKIWTKDSIDILKFPIDKYNSKRTKLLESSGFKIDSSIKKLLYKPVRKRMLNVEKVRCFIYEVDDYLSDEEIDTLYRARSNWEKKNYNFISSRYKSDFVKWQAADYILCFTSVGKQKTLELFQVMDTTEYVLGKEKYFVAIQRVKGTGIRQLDAEKTKTYLKAAGLKNNNRQKAGFLNKTSKKKIWELFGLK